MPRPIPRSSASRFDRPVPYLLRARSKYAALGFDRPCLLRRLETDGADVTVLVPDCPVRHQTASLAAPPLKTNGIPTVVMGCLRDSVEQCGVPQFCFSDFPLGNSAGKPHDPASQAAALELALQLLEAAPGPRAMVQPPQRWAVDALWKLDYANLGRLAPARLEQERQELARQKQIARQVLQRDKDAAA